jgi:hypothetical protein
MRHVALAVGSLVLATACSGSHAGHRPTSGVRPPTPQERRQLVAETTSDYAYESDPAPYRPGRIGIRLPFRFGLRHLQPRVVRIRVSRRDPRFAVEVVELRDERGRRRPGTEVRLLERVRGDPPWALFAESGTKFEIACTRATPKPIRDLSCPSAWSVLGYPRPRVLLNAAVSMRIHSGDISAVDWRNVTVPGAACGATQPIRLHPTGWGDAFVRSAVRPWWPAVSVGAGSADFGDLDGDGRDEAVLDLDCSNAGGTAAGQLAFASVVYAMRGHVLRSIGIVTPRQPLAARAVHVPLEFAEIGAAKVVAHEAWYGPYDGDCCASGRARTIWASDRGRLRPVRTTVLQKPWSSPLLIFDALGEPGDQELSRERRTRVTMGDRLRFAVSIESLGNRTKRNVKLTLTIRRGSTRPIVRTRRIDRIAPLPADMATVSFGRLGQLHPGKATVTVEIADAGAYPVRYPVRFVPQ